MRFLARLVAAVFLLQFFFFLAPRQANADAEFEISYKVRYQIDENGFTQVNQDIVLENKTTNKYADKFELKIGSTKVKDVKAADSTGPMKTDVKFENNLTTISVQFNQKVIGAGKTFPWTLSYSSGELTTKSGQIWEISIPRLAKSQDLGDYQATVSVPASFGPIAFTTPQPKSTTKLGTRQEFLFDKNLLTQSGISMSFGEKQVFSLNLKYHLENNNLTSQFSQITLPPDNNYQKIVLEEISPKPQDVQVDSDGNFLAKYKLSSQEKMDIMVKGYVEVFSKPFRNIYKNLSMEEKNRYLIPQRYWETDNAVIKDKAKQLKTPEEIYRFVSDYLTYNEERLKQPRLERLGAAAALNAPKDAVCTEFTDLFVALARAAQIPAREVEGYAYTQNERLRPLSLALSQGDVLHAWPEFWDDKVGWVQVDPTWASTSGGLDYFNKLDFNHITFVQRGLSSVGPLPAGAFKKEEEQGKKYLDIAFAKDLPTPVTSPALSLFMPEKIIAGIPLKIRAEIQNAGTASILNQKVTLATTSLKSKDSMIVPVEILPPFSKKELSYTLQSENLLQKEDDNIILSYADTQISKPIKILPFYNLILTKTFGLTLASSAFILTSGLFLYKRTHQKQRKIKSSN